MAKKSCKAAKAASKEPADNSVDMKDETDTKPTENEEPNSTEKSQEEIDLLTVEGIIQNKQFNFNCALNNLYLFSLKRKIFILAEFFNYNTTELYKHISHCKLTNFSIINSFISQLIGQAVLESVDTVAIKKNRYLKKIHK